jgi:hypothetical protein
VMNMNVHPPLFTREEVEAVPACPEDRRAHVEYRTPIEGKGSA